MYFKHLLIFCLFFLNLFYIPAYAQSPHEGVGIYLDQDLFLPYTNEDRDYTMGLAVEFFSDNEDESLYIFDQLLRRTRELLPVYDPEEEISHSFMLGILTYTPDDLENTSPIYNDRPYSSLIYLSNKQIQANHKHAVVSEILLGVLGTSVSRELQSGIHSFSRSIFDSNDPVEAKGWGNQISKGETRTGLENITKR